jgi:hypothetical protein
MILSRSLQVVSPALELWTRPAVIAASLMISQPFASQAAGTVSHTSAESIDRDLSYYVVLLYEKKKKTIDVLKSATAPISLVI